MKARDQRRRAAAATRSAATSRGWGLAARAGNEVSTTQMVPLAGSAQQHFLVRHQAAEADAVHPDPVDVAAAGAGTFTGGGVGTGRHLRGTALGRNQLGGAHGGTGRGIHLVRVVQFDDLHRFEVTGRLGGECGRQH